LRLVLPSLFTGFALKAANSFKRVEDVARISLTPWLQSGDLEAILATQPF